jgi:hypothetical protein
LTISEERRKQVTDLYYNQGKTTREIAKIERMSIRDISNILKEEESKQQKDKQYEISSKAYKLFSEKKSRVDVAIELNLREPEVTRMFIEYCRLKRLDKLISIYKATNGRLGPFLKLYKQLVKQKGMSIEQVVNVLDTAVNRLPHMESLYIQARDETQKMQQTRQHLLNDMNALEYKISLLDKTAFSCEQECNRTEQQVQALTAKKDRLEKWIAKISDNDDDLKQIVKENVKAALSENRQIISVAFTALLQTLKANPKMVNSIYATSLTNVNDRRHNDNDDNDNAIKYVESNKDNILDLAEKNYESLVEALTNNTIATIAADSSSNPTLSSPLSSQFSILPNQSDVYRTEEPESFGKSKGDIAE